VFSVCAIIKERVVSIMERVCIPNPHNHLAPN
jgi:hypothetical protein